MIKLALALIVKGTDEEAALLDRCLASVAPHMNGVFITITHKKGEKLNQKVEEVAKKYNAITSSFEWVNDFSAARNFNFEQVPKDYDYIMWTDADDIWRGIDKLKDTVLQNATVDAFGFWYYYDWDESRKPTIVHKKTMVVRNDGTFYWSGRLHEDLMARRMISPYLIEGIERLHLSSDKRHGENAVRNLEIAKEEAKVNSNDPRSYWNLANSFYGVADYDNARKNYEIFLEESESDEEKYLAHVRLADVNRSQNRREDAIKELQYAIGLEPMIPDAYLHLAHMFYDMGNYDKAEKYCIDGIQLKPYINNMIVYNPRDYDYNPMMLLANIYYHKNRPDRMLTLLEGCLQIYPDDANLKALVEECAREKEALREGLEAVEKLMKIKDKKKLKAAIDALPLSTRSHPSVVSLRNKHFVKQGSTGRDLVIYCGETTHMWNPETFKKEGIGGSEEAVIHLAQEWAKLGWNVTVYNYCGSERVIDGNVTFAPFWEYNYRDKQDVTILWRRLKPLDADINSSKIYVDLHDVIPEGEFTEKRLAKIDKIFVKSKFHRSLFPNVPDAKFEIVPNGLDIYADSSIKKDPYLIINTSSPDRSMDVLPRLFREVKKRVPKAKLQWAYGWDIFRASNQSNPKQLKWAEETQKEMDESGIETLGRLTQKEVGRLYQKGTIFAYPTEFAEIDCISVKKAQAAGMLAVTTDFGALAETNVTGIKIHSTKNKDTWNRPYQFHFGLEDKDAQKAWVEAVVHALKHPSKPSPYEVATWPVIAKLWNHVFAA